SSPLMAEPLVIWGASGHAKVVAEIVRLDPQGFQIIGFLDDLHPSRHGMKFCGAAVLGGREQLPVLTRQGVRRAIVAVGECAARARLANVLTDGGFELVTVVHPRAVIAESVEIGAGSVVMAGAVVNPDVRIGSNVVVNTSASIDHDCAIGDGVTISPGATLGGNVTVGPETWIGIGAAVRELVRIGRRSIIGAGAVVLTDIGEEVVAYGVPARVIRGVEADA
ncbi:MAG: acetyltransferase, partial [Planctomycetaceae bacterium]